MPYPLTSAYVKVFPKSILPVGLWSIVLVHVLADVLADDLPLEPIFEAFVAEFVRDAKNNKNWTKIARLWPDLSKVSSSIDRARRLPTLIDVLDGDAWVFWLGSIEQLSWKSDMHVRVDVIQTNASLQVWWYRR